MAASVIMLLEQKSVHRLLTGQHNEMHGMIELVLTWGSVIMLLEQKSVQQVVNWPT